MSFRFFTSAGTLSVALLSKPFYNQQVRLYWSDVAANGMPNVFKIIQINISPNIGDGPNFMHVNRLLELFLWIRVRFNTDHLFDWLINQFENASRHTYIVLTMGEWRILLTMDLSASSNRVQWWYATLPPSLAAVPEICYKLPQVKDVVKFWKWLLIWVSRRW